MSPNLLRLYAELTAEERREDREWRRSATPEQLALAEELLAQWYLSKDEAVEFKDRLERLVEGRYAE